MPINKNDIYVDSKKVLERFKKIAEYIYNNSVPDDQYVSYLDYPVESEEYGNYYRRFGT